MNVRTHLTPPTPEQAASLLRSFAGVSFQDATAYAAQQQIHDHTGQLATVRSVNACRRVLGLTVRAPGSPEACTQDWSVPVSNVAPVLVQTPTTDGRHQHSHEHLAQIPPLDPRLRPELVDPDKALRMLTLERLFELADQSTRREPRSRETSPTRLRIEEIRKAFGPDWVDSVLRQMAKGLQTMYPSRDLDDGVLAPAYDALHEIVLQIAAMAVSRRNVKMTLNALADNAPGPEREAATAKLRQRSKQMDSAQSALRKRFDSQSVELEDAAHKIMQRLERERIKAMERPLHPDIVADIEQVLTYSEQFVELMDTEHKADDPEAHQRWAGLKA